MDLFNEFDDDNQTKLATEFMTTAVDHYRHRGPYSIRQCSICGSKAIGMNFGALTCAPCKAFFRRNARRKEILQTPCQHPETNLYGENKFVFNETKTLYLQIRRCSACRLHRCFHIGMKEDLVRTEEENERHKQLVDTNRKRRDLLKQQQQQLQDNQLSIRQCIVTNSDLLNEVDWCHLSNIIYVYDTYCLKTYLQQSANGFFHEKFHSDATMEYYTLLPMNLTFSVSRFLRTLPVFQSLSRPNQLFLCRNNLRRLILVNNHEVNQSCFSEPWQIAARRASWQFMCGSELYKQLAYSEQLAERSWIADPIVTRLWIIVLFFSTSLFCYYESKSSIMKVKKKTPFTDIQNAYLTLLWKYLLHRHGHMESVRIYSNLIHVYLHMLHVGLSVNIRLRTRKDFRVAHETLDQLAAVDTIRIQ